MNVVKGAFALFSGLFVLAAGVMTVRADSSDITYTESFIDRSKTCSVTIHEYVSNSGDAAVHVDGNAEGVEGLLPDGAVPVSDVGFSCMKIADLILTQADASGNIEPACFAGLSPGLMNLLSELKILPSADPGRRYQLSEITEFIAAADKASVSAVAELVDQCGVRLPDTDEEGMTTAEGLTQGVYLFAESKSPEGCVPCAPFCVALPQMNISEMNIGNTTYGPGEIWLYDINVYPKSRSVSVQKSIAVPEKNEKGEIVGEKYESSATACFGDTLKYVITSVVPKVSEGVKNRLYVIEDTMDPGLIYAGDLKVTVGESADTAAPLTMKSDYKLDIASNPATLRITFTKKGLARLGEIERESRVYVTYSARLGSNAVIADPGNMNTVSLLYGTDHSKDIRTVSPPVTVFTYMLTLKKTFSPAQDHFGDVRFSLSDGNEKMHFIKESDGVYHLSCDDKEYDQTILVSPNDSTGILVLKGFANGTYTLTEEETVPDYSLLGESVEINIRNRNQSLDIENRKSIDLVHTGGSGLISVICGAALMIALGCLILLRASEESEGSAHK